MSLLNFDKINKWTLNQLLDQGVHYGTTSLETFSKNTSYVCATKNGTNILDLKLTKKSLNKALNLIIQMSSKKGTDFLLLIPKNHILKNSILLERLSSVGIRIHFIKENNSSWIPGSLGNPNLFHLIGRIPSLFLIINSTKYHTACKEAILKKVPIVNLCDLDSKILDKISHKIPGNDDSFLVSLLFIELFYNAAKFGKILRELHISNNLLKRKNRGNKTSKYKNKIFKKYFMVMKNYMH